MIVALLTTDTVHHAYFAWQVAARANLAAVLLERRRARAPFETAHPFERQRDEYERDALGDAAAFGDVARTSEHGSVNDPDAIRALRAVRPDLLLVYGTGPVSRETYGIARVAVLNCHGGNPEEYRGLDSHLWAVYHDDFENLVATLHHVDDGIDTGAIALQKRLALDRSTGLHTLRAITARACVDMALAAIAAAEGGVVPSRPQRQRGRYYSFMPAVLKDVCVRKWQRHVASL